MPARVITNVSINSSFLHFYVICVFRSAASAVHSLIVKTKLASSLVNIWALNKIV